MSEELRIRFEQEIKDGIITKVARRIADWCWDDICALNWLIEPWSSDCLAHDELVHLQDMLGLSDTDELYQQKIKQLLRLRALIDYADNMGLDIGYYERVLGCVSRKI